jgi:23S rRNA (uracil1939-C5)-methyltransferase
VGGVEISLEITALSRSGAGLGRDPTGRVVFVPFTCPGDFVRVEILSEEKRFAEAKILEILKPSPDRITPKCPVFQKCGGCEWQHLPYSLQWQTKKSGVIHALDRVGVKASELPFEEFPADQIWEYRNRVQLRGYRENLGFYGKKSKKIVSIDRCEIAREEINAFLPDVRNEGFKRTREYKAEIEVFPTGAVTVAWNAPHSSQGFRQVHDEQNRKLQGWVSHSLSSGNVLLDLYGGSGNLSLGIRDKYAEIHCVDVGTPDLPEEIPNFHFHKLPVYHWLKENFSHLKNFSAIDVILDPPREGLGSDLGAISDMLRDLNVRKILYIGCETDSWARGIHRLNRAGFYFTSFGALDFFPQTHHVESLAILEKQSTIISQ